MTSRVFDLFGAPVDLHHGAKGRPSHVPSDENRNKIMMLMAVGRDNAQVAMALGISEKTLRKHYLPELKMRDAAALRLEAAQLFALHRGMTEGKVAAVRELDRRQLRALVERADRIARGEGAAETAPKGKKESAMAAAQQAGHDDPMWRGVWSSSGKDGGPH